MRILQQKNLTYFHLIRNVSSFPERALILSTMPPRRRQERDEQQPGNVRDAVQLLIDRHVHKAEQNDKTAELGAHALDFGKTLGSLKDAEQSGEALCEGMAQVLELHKEVEEIRTIMEKARPDIERAMKDAEDLDAQIPSDEAFLRILQGHATTVKRQRTDVTEHPDYKRLRKLCKLKTNDDDDDVEIDESTAMILKDPINQKILVDPMKSKKCGHVYSKSTVLEYFRRPQKCAWPGCNATLCSDDFERDVETELGLKRYERSQAASQTQQRTQAVDLDDDDDDER